MNKKIKKIIVDLYWKMCETSPFFVKITKENMKTVASTFLGEETLKYPNGTYQIFSPHAGEIFKEISRTYLSSEKDFSRKISFYNFHSALKDEFGAYLYAKPKKMTDEDILELISKTRAKLEQKFQSIAYYFPLKFFDSIETDKFNIGSIEIISQKVFCTKYKQQIIESIIDNEAITDKDVLEWDNSPFTAAFKKAFKKLSKQEKLDFIQQSHSKTNIRNNDILESICENKWIIRVEVGPCHLDTSRKLAKSVAAQAINILKVIYTERHADKINVIEFSENDKSHYITEYSDKSFYISSSLRTKDQLANGWYKYLQPYSYLLSEFGIILDNRLQFKPVDEYQFRIWEAVQWFTSSFSDETVGMKINKYCNAVERLVLSGEGNSGITKRFKTRAAFLCAKDKKDYQYLVGQFNKFYGARSDYSHGRVSHNESSNKLTLMEALGLSRLVIERSILFYQKRLKPSKSVTKESISKAFDAAISKV